MPSPWTRRTMLSVLAGGLSATGGCVGVLSDASRSIQVHVTNATDEKREIWVQLTSDTQGGQLAESLLLDPNSIDVVDADVPAGTYRFTVSGDANEGPSKRTVEWTIDEVACSTRASVTLAPTAGDPEFVLRAGACDGS